MSFTGAADVGRGAFVSVSLVFVSSARSTVNCACSHTQLVNYFVSPCSYGVPGADQQHQGEAPGNPRSQEAAGGADHESGKPGPQSRQRTHTNTPFLRTVGQGHAGVSSPRGINVLTFLHERARLCDIKL